jgi:hypothetical protein
VRRGDDAAPGAAPGAGQACRAPAPWGPRAAPAARADTAPTRPPPPAPARPPGNYQHRHNVCVYGASLAPAVASADGFALVDEGAGNKTKWGYVATAPGAALTLRVDTTTPYGLEKGNGSRTVAVYLAHLKSYEHMGIATVRCAPARTGGLAGLLGWRAGWAGRLGG